MAGSTGRPIRHASALKPRLYPFCNDTDPIDVDRAQTVNLGVDRPNEQVYEIGRDGEMTRDFDIPQATASITQYEYGTLKELLALANLVSKPSGGLTLQDFDTSRVDLVTFEKEDSNLDQEISRWLPKLVVNSIGLNIGDPDARIERTFELAGDDHITLRYDNKAFIYKKFTSGVTGAVSFDVSDPVPTEDPNETGSYIFRVDEIDSAGTPTTLTEGTDWTYDDGGNTVDVVAATTGYKYKVYYSSTDYGTSGDPVALNDTDDYFLKAYNCDIFIIDSLNTNRIYKLQSLSLTASFDRGDFGEIGNDEKILKEVTTRNVAITLNGFVKNASIEEIMRDKSGLNWGILDVRDYVNTTSLVVHIYRDRAKTDFALGYRCDNLVFPGVTRSVTANDFLTKDINLECDNMTISDDIGDL